MTEGVGGSGRVKGVLAELHVSGIIKCRLDITGSEAMEVA